MIESDYLKPVYAPVDEQSVYLVPIIIANHGYLFCHENQCIYCVNTEEKIGYIKGDRSIFWYSPNPPKY